MTTLIKKIMVISVLVLIVGCSLMLIGNKMRADVIKEQQEEQEYREWLADNCECLEHEIFYCQEGFELRGIWCYNPLRNATANRLRRCSKYDCNGEIKLWNNETQKWEN